MRFRLPQGTPKLMELCLVVNTGRGKLYTGKIMANSVLEYVQKNILKAGITNTRLNTILDNCNFTAEEKEKIKKLDDKTIATVIKQKVQKNELSDEIFIKDLYLYSPTFSELKSLPISFHTKVVNSEAFKNLTADNKFEVTVKLLCAGGFDYKEDKGWFHESDGLPIQNYQEYKDIFHAHVVAVSKSGKVESLQEIAEPKEQDNQGRIAMAKAFNSLPLEHQKELIEIKAKGEVMCEKGNMAQYAAFKKEFLAKYREYVAQDKILDEKSARANICGTKEWLERRKLVIQIRNCQDPKLKAELKKSFTDTYGEYQGYDENGIHQFVREDGDLKMPVPGETVTISHQQNANTALMLAIARQKGIAYDQADDILAISNLRKQERAFTNKGRTF